MMYLEDVVVVVRKAWVVEDMWEENQPQSTMKKVLFLLAHLIIQCENFLGFFGEPTTTTWVRGEPAEVAWYSNAHHRGGYAYRLCKVNNGEVWKVTEECFQNGHLNFYGETV